MHCPAFLKPLILTAAMLSFAGCGGGGGGSNGPLPQPNRAPSFTSSPSVLVPENTAGAVYAAAAADPDGDSLTFSLTGGADRAAFSITAQGALTFVVAPDFETLRTPTATTPISFRSASATARPAPSST